MTTSEAAKAIIAGEGIKPANNHGTMFAAWYAPLAKLPHAINHTQAKRGGSLSDLMVLAVYEREMYFFCKGANGYYYTQMIFQPVAALSAKTALIELCDGLSYAQTHKEQVAGYQDHVQTVRSVSELRIEYTHEIRFPVTGD